MERLRAFSGGGLDLGLFMIGRMGDEPRAGSFWTEEINEAVPTPMRRKRKNEA